MLVRYQFFWDVNHPEYNVLDISVLLGCKPSWCRVLVRYEFFWGVNHPDVEYK
jgi:hypothetical protein